MASGEFFIRVKLHEHEQGECDGDGDIGGKLLHCLRRVDDALMSVRRVCICGPSFPDRPSQAHYSEFGGPRSVCWLACWLSIQRASFGDCQSRGRKKKNCDVDNGSDDQLIHRHINTD